MTEAGALLVRYLRQRRELGETELVFAGHPLWVVPPAPAPPDRLAVASQTAAVSDSGPETKPGRLDAGVGEARDGVEDGVGGEALLAGFASTVAPATRLVIVAEEPEAALAGAASAVADASVRLLHTLLTSIGISPSQVYFNPLPKCYLPGKGDGPPKELEEWEAGLRHRIGGTAGVVVLSFGVSPTQILLKTSGAIGTLRGGTHLWADVPLVPTYALAMIRQNPPYIRAVWEDLQRVRAILDR